jgi:hypothetical protein
MYFGPLIAVGVLALVVLGFSVITMAFELLAAVMKHAGI